MECITNQNPKIKVKEKEVDRQEKVKKKLKNLQYLITILSRKYFTDCCFIRAVLRLS